MAATRARRMADVAGTMEHGTRHLPYGTISTRPPTRPLHRRTAAAASNRRHAALWEHTLRYYKEMRKDAQTLGSVTPARPGPAAPRPAQCHSWYRFLAGRETRTLNGTVHYDWREPVQKTIMLNTDMCASGVCACVFTLTHARTHNTHTRARADTDRSADRHRRMYPPPLSASGSSGFPSARGRGSGPCGAQCPRIQHRRRRRQHPNMHRAPRRRRPRGVR